MKTQAEQHKTPENAVNLQLLGSYEKATSSQTMPTATEAKTPKSPPEKAHAPRERGGVAGEIPQSSATRPHVKTTEREIAMQVRRGFEKSHTLLYIVLRLQKWRPGNDKLIEDTAIAVYEFEERYGVTAFERAQRIDPHLTREEWGE
jgi:hypothetical protein